MSRVAVVLTLFVTGAMAVALWLLAAVPPARADASYPGDARFYDWASGGADSGLYQNRSNTNQADWMKWVADSTPIGNLSIPGTHDSMAAHGGDNPQTQGLCGDSGPGDITPCDLTEQLESGIRFFDIRIACLDNVRTGYKEDLTIWHGDAYQYANLGDVLDAFRSFLTAHGDEVVLMRIATEHNVDEQQHEGCGGNLTGYGSQNEENFARYWQEYSDIFWTNNGQYPGSNGLPTPFPTIGEARGKVIPLTHFDTDRRYGLFWNEVTSYENYNENVGATWELDDHWRQKRDNGLIPANHGIVNRPAGDKKYFHTGFNGSGGVWPNTVAFGDGISFPGVNYYGLQYLMDRNVTSTGIIGMDFPGGALINAIIAHNLRHADLSEHAAVKTSFGEMVEHLAPALGNHEHSHASTRVCDAVTCGDPSHGATVGFFDHVMPGQHFHAMGLRGASTLVDHEGLYGQGNTDGMFIAVWNGNYHTVVPDAGLRQVVDQTVPTSGSTTERVSAVYNALRATYPGTLWHVIAKRVTEERPDSAVHVYTYYAQYHKGEWHDVAYYVAGYAPGTLTGTVTGPTGPASAGTPVTYRATFTATKPCADSGSCRGPVAGQVTFTNGGSDILGCAGAPLRTNADGTATATCTTTHDRGGSFVIGARSSGAGWQEATATTLTSTVINPVRVYASGYQTYGDASPDLDHSATPPDGVQVDGTLTCTNTTGDAISPLLDAGTYQMDVASCAGLSLTGPNADQYDLLYISRPFVVGVARLTVEASDASMTYGGTPPTITRSYSGFVNGEGESVLTSAPTCSSGATAASSVGTYTSVCQGGSAPNYDLQHTSGRVTVSPAGLTVTASSPRTTYGDALPSVAPIFGGFVNGDDAADLTSQPACATAAAADSGAGDYATTCTGAGATNYHITAVGGTHTIGQAPLTVTASSPRMTYGDATPSVTPSYQGFVKGEGPSALSTPPACSTTAGPTTHAGTVPRTTCSGAAADNYSFSYVHGSVTVVPRQLLVTASSASATYGTTPTVQPLYSGFVNGQGPSVLDTQPACSTSATATSGVGSYDTNCSGGSDTDYVLLHASGTWTITPAPLTVTAPDAVSVYGQNAPAVSPTYSGFVNGEGPSVLTSQATCSTDATSLSDAGTYTITCSGAGADNYAVTNVDGVLTVAKAPLAVIAEDKSRPYDEAEPAFSWRLEGYVNDDTDADVTGVPMLTTPATRESSVGAYPIDVEVGSLTAINYRFVPTPGTLTVVQAVTRVTETQVQMSRSVDAPNGRVSATLRYGSADKPVVGVTVTFSSDGETLCSATTDAAGVASCALTDRSQRPMIARDGFLASFAGAENFLPSSADGSVNS